MRVNVTYSLDLNEVKQLVQRLLVKSESDLQELQSLFFKIQASVENNNEKEATAFIKECRDYISSLDYSLFDCRNILTGYQQASLQIEQIEQQAQESLQTSVSSGEDETNETR